MKRKMSMSGDPGKSPEEICSKSLTQELFSCLHCVLPRVLYQIRKSNGMQSRGERKKEGIWERSGSHGWEERGDVSVYREGKHLIWIKFFQLTLILRIHREGDTNDKYRVALPSAAVDGSKSISVPGWANKLFPRIVESGTKESMSQSNMVACTHYKMCTSQKHRGYLSHLLYTRLQRERMKPTSSEKSRWGESNKCIQDPAIALVFL